MNKDIDFLSKDTYNFHLPENLVATKPEYKRENCRLMTLNIGDGSIEHKRFFDIANYLRKNDVLVLNDSKVIPARILAKKSSKGAAEILLLKQIDETKSIWECLIKGKNIKERDVLTVECERKSIEPIEAVIEKDDASTKLIRFSKPLDTNTLSLIGKMPIPPYIIQNRKRRGEEEYNGKDKEYYQNVYAKNEGSVASATSGLHFTKELLYKIKNMNVTVCFVTLHIGFSTFNPLKENNLKEHVMHKETFIITKDTADIVKKAKNEGRRIVSCGTTVARVLESEYENNTFKRLEGETDIFIYPPYSFKCIDALITNFHTPHSTLLTMVSAFGGYKNIVTAYRVAVENEYRFFSYGDAMFIYR